MGVDFCYCLVVLFCLGLFILVVSRGGRYCLMLVATVYVQPEEIKSVSQRQEYLLCARNSCLVTYLIFQIQENEI